MGPPRDKQVALSTFSYVFSELVHTAWNQISGALAIDATSFPWLPRLDGAEVQAIDATLSPVRRLIATRLTGS